MKRAASAVILTFLLIGTVGVTDVGAEPEAVVAMDPTIIEYDCFAVGQTFTVAVRIEDVEELWAFEIQIGWNTTWIEYVSHIVKVPIESYPDGILHEPTIKLKEVIDESASIPGAELGTMAWLCYSSIYGAPPGGFNGSGTVCEITFGIKDYPILPDPDIKFYIYFSYTELRQSGGWPPIWHTTQDCHVIFHASQPPYGPTARFTLSPETAKRRELVTFDASNSLPGFNGAHEVPIIRYYWNFRDGNITTTYTPIVYHSFRRARIYYVTLTVYAPGATPETDTTTRKVTVSSIPVGGYSLRVKEYGSEKPLSLYLALIVILTTIFTIIRRKEYYGKMTV